VALPTGWRARLRALLHWSAAERDLEQEIRHHIALETEKNERSGMTAAEARRRALVAFGGVEVAKEAHRDGRGVRWLEEFTADSLYALRTFRRSPGFAAAAILTLALGVGANTAIFSVVNAVMIRPLPFAARDRLMMLTEENPERGWVRNIVAPANALDWGEQVKAFDDVAMYNPFGGTSTLTGQGAPVLLRSQLVSGNFFSLLGVRPQAGRTFTPDETWDRGTPIVVISDRVWRDRFGARADLIDQTIELNGRKVQVVGVVPASFSFPGSDAEIWRPLGFNRADRTQVWFRRAHWMRAIARIRPGVTRSQADAEFQSVVRRLQRDFPATNATMGAAMTPLHEFLVGDTRRPLVILLGAVAMLLLIACANVGNLLLVHAAGREREAALRLALGARTTRLVRQALTESLVLSTLGGLAGLALGWWGTRALLALQPPGLIPMRDVGLSWMVLAYVLVITTMSGLLFGVAPALWSSRRIAAEVLKEGGRSGTTGHRVRRWANVLVVSEVALALLMSVGAGLLVRSFWHLERVDAGLDVKGVLTASFALPSIRYDSASKVSAFYDGLGDRVRALPSVESLAAVSQLPLTDFSWSSDFSVFSWPADKFGTEIIHRVVTPDYLRVLHIPLTEGRFFTGDDRRGNTRVVVINDVLARQYFKGESPLGLRMSFDRKPDSASVWRTIVGVVGSEHQAGLDKDARAEVFEPFTQSTKSSMTLVIRTTGDPASLAPAVRRAVSDLDPNLAILKIEPMSVVRAAALARQRFLTILLLAFSGVGLLLAVVGVYGVMAQLARGRTREMGIRVALGAQASQVQWLVVRHGLLLTATGEAIGMLAAFFATRAMVALLYGIDATDPPTFFAVPFLLALAAMAACWVPAWRSARADPMVTLRSD
jgi:putative ABC transport system permease protein